MSSPRLQSSQFYVVSFNYKYGVRNTIWYSKGNAQGIITQYINECRLRQIEGEIILSKVKILEKYVNKKSQEDYFNGVVKVQEGKILERLKISFE